LNFATFWKDLLVISGLWFCPIFWKRDTVLYLMSPYLFLDQPPYWILRQSVFFFMMFMFWNNILTSSA
jgi:hypothetical protein